jgi:hypothetical protein
VERSATLRTARRINFLVPPIAIVPCLLNPRNALRDTLLGLHLGERIKIMPRFLAIVIYDPRKNLLPSYCAVVASMPHTLHSQQDRFSHASSLPLSLCGYSRKTGFSMYTSQCVEQQPSIQHDIGMRHSSSKALIHSY